MARHVAEPFEPVDAGEVADQLRKAHRSTARALAVIGVDVLSKENDLFRAGSDEFAGFGLDFGYGPREFTSARIRHDAKAAELVATLLHGQKRRR